MEEKCNSKSKASERELLLSHHLITFTQKSSSLQFGVMRNIDEDPVLGLPEEKRTLRKIFDLNRLNTAIVVGTVI